MEHCTIDADGVNFEGVLAHPKVIKHTVVTNDVYLMYQRFGIQAASEVLFTEICNVLMGDGSHIDVRHVHLLVDVMCFHGYPLPLNRHGLNKLDKISPLQKSSFEEVTDVLFEAAMFGKPTDLRGVSENVIEASWLALVDSIEYKLFKDEEQGK